MFERTQINTIKLCKWVTTEVGSRLVTVFCAVVALVVSLGIGVTGLFISHRTLLLQAESEFRNSFPYLTRGIRTEAPFEIYLENVGSHPVQIDDIVLVLDWADRVSSTPVRVSLRDDISNETLDTFWPIVELQEVYNSTVNELIDVGNWPDTGVMFYDSAFHTLSHSEWLGSDRRLLLFSFTAFADSPSSQRSLDDTQLDDIRARLLFSNFSRNLSICVHYTSMWGNSSENVDCSQLNND